MPDISLCEAIEIANNYLNTLETDIELMLQTDKTMSEDFGWVFFYNSKPYVETGDFRFMLGGNAPLIVDKHTKQVTLTGTSHDISYYIENYN